MTASWLDSPQAKEFEKLVVSMLKEGIHWCLAGRGEQSQYQEDLNTADETGVGQQDQDVVEVPRLLVILVHLAWSQVPWVLMSVPVEGIPGPGHMEKVRHRQAIQHTRAMPHEQGSACTLKGRSCTLLSLL